MKKVQNIPYISEELLETIDKLNILTLFPDMFNGFLTESIIKRALDEKKVKINNLVIVKNVVFVSGEKEKLKNFIEKFL